MFQDLSPTAMSEKDTYPVDLKTLEEQPAAPPPRRSVLRKKLWLVGLAAAYCVAREGVAAWFPPNENWTDAFHQSSLQPWDPTKFEKLFL